MDEVARAAALLRAGGTVAFPTETVYGLGADATNARAVARIFEIKGRPRFNPLIVHIAEPGDAEAHARVDPRARALMERFWPGGLTVVLPRRAASPVAPLALAGLDTVALRCPAHPLARELLARCGRPVAAPSANRSGRLSPTAASHVRSELGDAADIVLDGGPCSIGVESTVVDLTGEPTLLRPGALAPAALGIALAAPDRDDAPKSPGQLASHYAPATPLRMNATSVRDGEALLAFGAPAPPTRIVRNLSASGDLAEAAANFFSMLRELDALGAAGIAAMPVPERGLGLAIDDRLRRAAAATSAAGRESASRPPPAQTTPRARARAGKPSTAMS